MATWAFWGMWAGPLFCYLLCSFSFFSIRNVLWQYNFDGFCNTGNNTWTPHHATQKPSHSWQPHHPNLTLCHPLALHIIHLENHKIPSFLMEICTLLFPRKILLILWASAQNVSFILTPAVTLLPLLCACISSNPDNTVCVAGMFLMYAKQWKYHSGHDPVPDPRKLKVWSVSVFTTILQMIWAQGLNH